MFTTLKANNTTSAVGPKCIGGFCCLLLNCLKCCAIVSKLSSHLRRATLDYCLPNALLRFFAIKHVNQSDKCSHEIRKTYYTVIVRIVLYELH